MISATTDLRYRAFAAEYVTNGFNGTQAAIVAGYAPHTAEKTAVRLVRNERVQELVTELLEPITNRYEITAERTLAHVAQMAYGDIGDVADWDGEKLTLKPKSEMTPEARRMVKKLKMRAKYHPMTDENPQEYYDVELEVEMYSKLDALVNLMKYQGLLPTTGKVRINVDARRQNVNFLSNLTREDIMRIAGVEE